MATDIFKYPAVRVSSIVGMYGKRFFIVIVTNVVAGFDSKIEIRTDWDGGMFFLSRTSDEYVDFILGTSRIYGLPAMKSLFTVLARTLIDKDGARSVGAGFWLHELRFLFDEFSEFKNYLSFHLPHELYMNYDMQFVIRALEHDPQITVGDEDDSYDEDEDEADDYYNLPKRDGSGGFVIHNSVSGRYNPSKPINRKERFREAKKRFVRDANIDTEV